jgi:hypothetical protein
LSSLLLLRVWIVHERGVTVAQWIVVVTDETDPMIGGRSCEWLDRDRDHVHEAIA